VNKEIRPITGLRASRLQKSFATIDQNTTRIAIYAGGLVHVYLMVLAIDSMFVYGTGISLASPVIRSASLFVVILLLIRQIATVRLKYDSLLLSLIAYMVCGTVIGLYLHNPSYPFGRHVFAGLTMICSYWLGLYLADSVNQDSRPFALISWTTLATCVFYLIIAGAAGQLGKPYTNLNGSVPLLFSLDVVLQNGQIGLVIACVIIVLATNLRAGVMGMSIILGIAAVRRLVKNHSPYVRLISAGLLSVVLFGGFTVLIYASNRLIAESPTFGERASRTMSLVGKILPKAIQPEIKAIDAKSNKTTAPDQAFSGRLGQAKAVYTSVKDGRGTLLFGSGFGGEYLWTYYSTYLGDQQYYTLHQTDLMTPYFLLTGGAVFAVSITLLFAWKMVIVATLATAASKLGILFVIGFGATMFFGFQPNAPLFWMLLAAFSRQRSLPISESARLFHRRGGAAS
jgi:hypothetical protein